VPLDNGEDTYLPIRSGKLDVEARWTKDARRSGYSVVVSTTEPVTRDYAICSTGTSCVVRKRVAILPNQEMSWTVKVVTTKGKRLVMGVRVCLAGGS
jgi:hypothetical protein